MRFSYPFFCFALLLGMPGFIPAMQSTEGFEMESLLFYQPNEILSARLSGTEDLIHYIDRLKAVCLEYFAGARVPETLHTIVALRSGNRSRVWFVSSIRAGDDTAFVSLRKKLEEVPSCKIRQGIIAFVLSGKIAGGDGKGLKEGKDLQPPIPQEWLTVATKSDSLLFPDGLLDVIWPDNRVLSDVAENTEIEIPEGYELQMLEPLGGKIAKPKGWFCYGGMTESGCMWVISKEKTNQGEYDTGLRIQGEWKIKERIGKTAEASANNFLDLKKRQTVVVRECETTSVSPFLRRCVEVEEDVERGKSKRKFHVVYSALWSNDMDMVVITTFGAPVEEWCTARDISEVMARFQLLDMDYIRKMAKEENK